MEMRLGLINVAKMLVAWAALVMVLTVQCQAQYDPLGSDIFTLPDDMRRTSSLDAQKSISIPMPILWASIP